MYEKDKKESIKKAIELAVSATAKDGKKEMARNMLKKNMSIEDISDVTGLTMEEVKKLKKEL
ncbi:MAG: hypothetical protein IJR82_03350 [Bacilli bacterium]|nr:hypothetical protein [Bacilli bacterium]